MKQDELEMGTICCICDKKDCKNWGTVFKVKGKKTDESFERDVHCLLCWWEATSPPDFQSANLS